MLNQTLDYDKEVVSQRSESPQSETYPIKNFSIQDVLIYREFRDRFKTWEQIKFERYFC
jgi:hypothetical protein